jgi:uncharacterized membrane protein YgcG
MSQDFVKVLVKDDRLNVTDAVSYAVHKGGQNMTSAQFNAISQTPSSVTFNIQVPSEQTIIDRRILWSSTVLLKMTVVGTASNAGLMPINVALTDALAPFPLHQLASVMTATINNNSVSINIRDVLPALLRFNDRRELQRYNGYTPVAYDLLAQYPDGVGTNLNSLGGWNNTSDNDLISRGAWALDGITSAPAGTQNYTALPAVLVPPTPLVNGASQDIWVQFTVSEPLLISPFIFCDPKTNNQGFYGVQNMNMVFNIGDASRVWRTCGYNALSGGGLPQTPYGNTWISAMNVVNFTNTKLIFNFLTPHPSDLMPARNAVPYYELPRFITSAQTSQGGYVPSTANASPAVFQLTTSSLQLNQIPDKLIIQVRNPLASTSWGQPDAFLCIKGISINFNNQSGILASATQQDLYRYSVENGSNQSWFEFSGYATVPDASSGAGRKIPTSGSLLVLEFGKDIQLTEDYYASGSLGNFNLQVNLQCYNQYSYAITPEIVLITMNSGLFVNERGTSSTYTGILTKQDVLEASAQEPMFQSSVKRLVGGGFLDSLKSVAGKLLPHLLKHGKEELGKSGHPVAKLAHSALGAMGYGSSGGGVSGGGSSGGGSSGGARMKLADRLMSK